MTVPIASLLPGESPRLAGEDDAHARALADVESPLPPILVNRRTMRVIDGMHRLRAALIRGRDTIEVRFFEGTDDLAFLLAVKENIAHGLPLSLADREAAALRIVLAQPQWSDRAIAAAAGLAAKTVAAIRERSTERSQQLNSRIGRDGRVRPLDGAKGRLRASEIILQRPGASLREVAREAGISVATARDVRERVRLGRDPLPPRQRPAAERVVSGERGGPSGPGGSGPPVARAGAARPEPSRGEAPSPAEKALAESARPPSPVGEPLVAESPVARPSVAEPSVLASRVAARSIEVVDWPSVRQKLRKDPALKYRESGRALLHWFDTHVVDPEEWQSVINAVPPHWSGNIAALARSLANRWIDMAVALEGHRERASG